MSDKTHIVCGIDPGLHQSGYAVLRYNERDDTIALLDAGVIRCSRSESLATRLAELANSLDDVLNEHAVRTMAVEQVYSHYQRPRTAVLMAHARGVILLEAARRGIRVLHLPSTTVKKHLTGNGRATKEQMQRAVVQTFSLKQIPEPPDVADALAIAFCATHIMLQPARIALANDDLLTK